VAVDDERERLKVKLAALLGGLSEAREPADPAHMEILMPDVGDAPFPAVICIPGHGNDYAFAHGAVERGLAVVVLQLSECEPAAGAALLLGETLLGWRVRDVMRAVDHVQTRSELDGERVGCVGFSGGGAVALFASALDVRIRCAYISGYLNTFRASIMSRPHCIDNYVPGILRWAEMYDVAGLIAPRPLYVESGENDELFPVAAARESFERVAQMYSLLGAADGSAQQEIFDGGHRFHGGRGWDFLADALL